MAKRKKEIETDLCDSPVVIALDPGGTTGWSIMQVHPESLIDPQCPILSNIDYWQHGQFTGNENRQAKEAAELIEQWPGAAVVIEDFILRKFLQDRDLLAPVRITARVEYALYLRGQSFFKQQPSEAKGVATDDRLKAWKLYRSEGAEQHARDADRHAITWLRKAKERSVIRSYSWPHLYGVGMDYGPDEGWGDDVQSEEDGAPVELLKPGGNSNALALNPAELAAIG